MEHMEIENRSFPYVLVGSNLLKQVKESAAEGLFKSFELLVGKDVRENSVKFEALLGVYTTAIQFVKFLETGLAVSCINTEFNDLRRMTDGKIQFRVSVPTIAHGDGRRPSKQKQYIIMKNCHKHHIGTEIELSIMDLQILFSNKETHLDFAEYVGAIKTITSGLQFGVDALERGLVDTVLTVKLRHAPPLFILKTLADPTYTERGLKKNVKSDLVSMFKKHLIDNSFFLDKADYMAKGKQYILSILSELIGAVSHESVYKGASTYTLQSGDALTGVVETTDNVMRKIINVLGQYSNSVIGPASYANYVVRGENLVTAIAYGRVMKTFDHFMSTLVDGESGASNVVNDPDGHADLPKTTIPMSVIQIGNEFVAIESLQRMYNETQFPHPLNRRMQYAYYFPVGLFLPTPQYSTTSVIRGVESPVMQSVESWIINKNNTLLCFNYQNALKTLCHPRIHNPQNCANALPRDFLMDHDEMRYGIASEVPHDMNLLRLTYNYYDGKNVAHVPDVAKKANMTTDDLLHPTNHKVLRLEVHPFFDFYIKSQRGAQNTYMATHRTMVGNIPQPLAPGKFQEGRGVQLEAASGLAHVIDTATMEMVQDTAFDPAYPVLCYVIEAMVHGQEEKFTMNIPLISHVIDTYYNNSGRLAFINSFPMLKFICTHLGNGSIAKEVYGYYRKIYSELIAMEQALIKLVGYETVGYNEVGEFVSALLDPNLLPPFAYDDIFTHLLNNSNRVPNIQIGDEIYNNPGDMNRFINIVGKMEDLVATMVNIYQERNNEDHDHRYVLNLGPLNDNDYNSTLEKIFYYVFLPVCTNGHLCGMGVDFEHVALTLTYNGPVFADVVNQDDSILEHLENGPLRDLLLASDIRPTVDMIRVLCTSFLTCPYITQAARVSTNRDPCQRSSTHDAGITVKQTVLVNGFVAFAMADRAREVTETLFYPVPFHKMYSDPMVAATLHPLLANYVTRLPSQRNAITFNVPNTIMAEYEEWHKSPMVAYVSTCSLTPMSLSAMLAMHLKLSAMSFIYQAKNKIHPGFALTVVRTDEVVAENLLYNGRGSSSVFVGQPTVTRKEVRSDAVTFEIAHELASLDMGLGYSSTIIPAHISSITTDMGVHCQDLFMLFPSEAYTDRQIYDFIKQKVGSERMIGAAQGDPMAYIGNGQSAFTTPGLAHGQLSTCEVILTPVTADVAYFQTTNSPRGRAACVISCDAYNNEHAEKYIYDHSIPDPAYEYRSTINPWASQVGSLGDVLYNTTFRQMAVPGVYSPCRQFFHKDTILKNNRGLFTLISEYVSRLSGTPATSNTDIQYVVVNGTDVFLEQPCQFFQEAYPTICASHRSMLDEFMSNQRTHAPVHMNQYMIEEIAPMKRVFKVGNKTVY
nr:major capsid protein [Bovine gammaherpesvirus 4]